MKDGFYWYKDTQGRIAESGTWTVVEVQDRQEGFVAYSGEERFLVAELPGEFRYIDPPQD